MLLLIGASVRDLTESAAESGLQFTGIDFFGDLDCRGKVITPDISSDLEPTTQGLLKIARGIECRGLVYGSGPENHRHALRYWEKRGLLLGNGYDSLVQARNPYLLREVLRKINVNMPRFYSPDQAPLSGSWLLKPLSGGSGTGIVRLPPKEAGIRGVLSRLHKPSRYIVQEYQDGIPASITFLADGSSALPVGSSYQIIQERNGKHPFRYIGNIVPLPAPSPGFWNDMAGIASHLTAAFGLRGLNTLDFILCGSGIRVLELNPRWSGSVELIEAWLARRLFLDHVRACGGELPMGAKWEEIVSARPLRFYGKKILYSDTSFTVQDYREGWQPLYQYGIRDIPRPGSPVQEDEPICTVLADGTSKEACMSKLEEKARLVRGFYEQKGKEAWI